MKRSLPVKRICMSVFGVLVNGITVGMFKHASLGVDPFQTLMSGLDAVIPIRFGTLYVIVCASLLIISLIFDRKKLGLATFINLFFLGYVAEYTQGLLGGWLPGLSMPARLLLLAAAVILSCLSASFYFTADLGVSVYDALSLIVSERQNKVPFRICRIISDLLCVLTGAVLCLISGFSLREIPTVVGIGTIITAFFMGPLIDLFNRKIAQPFLEK